MLTLSYVTSQSVSGIKSKRSEKAVYGYGDHTDETRSPKMKKSLSAKILNGAATGATRAISDELINQVKLLVMDILINDGKEESVVAQMVNSDGFNLLIKVSTLSLLKIVPNEEFQSNETIKFIVKTLSNSSKYDAFKLATKQVPKIVSTVKEQFSTKVMPLMASPQPQRVVIQEDQESVDRVKISKAQAV